MSLKVYATEISVCRIANQVYPDNKIEDISFQRYFSIPRQVKIGKIIVIGYDEHTTDIVSTSVGVISLGWYVIKNVIYEKELKRNIDTPTVYASKFAT